MKIQTCCFTGHRKIPPDQQKHVAERLKTEIVKLIDKGVIYFGTGGALGNHCSIQRTHHGGSFSVIAHILSY